MVATKEIPKSLIYEIIDDIPVYYRNYQQVLAENGKVADVRGYGQFTLYLLHFLREFLRKRVDNQYRILSGDGGLQVSPLTILTLDLTIFEKHQIVFEKLSNDYIDFPPKIVMQIDTKADGEILQQFNYYNVKTKKLLHFGVEKVIWIFTETEQVMVAEKNKPWLTVKWTDEIEILEQTFSINQVIDEAEKEV